MLRITVEERATEMCLLLEGRLEQPLVHELERIFTEKRVIAEQQPVIVDLCGLTGMDEAGEAILQKLYRQGATLRCGDVMNKYLVERMTHGPVKPLQAPCRPSHSDETWGNSEMEEKESANRDRF